MKATSHDPDCRGPRNCEYCRDILNETPAQRATRMATEDRERGLRSATGVPLLRASEAHPPRGIRLLRTPDEVLAGLDRDAAPPNPYAAATVRSAQGCPAVESDYRANGQPPDGYAIALRARQQRSAQPECEP